MPLTSPYRTFDTREPQFGGVALGPGQAEDWSFAEFASSVTIGPESVGNQIGRHRQPHVGSAHPAVPVGPPSSRTSRRIRPAPRRPLSSNLNTVEGPPVPNMAVLKYGADNTVRVYNLAGYAHYLFDASAVVLAD